MSYIAQRLDEVKAWLALGKRLASYTHGRRKRLAVALLMTFGMLATRLLEPWPLKVILDSVVGKRPLSGSFAWLGEWSGGDKYALLGILAGITLLLGVASGFFYYWANILTAKVGQRVVADLRHDVYAHVERMSLAWHARRGAGDILVRLIADVRLLRDAIIALPMNMAENVLLVVGMAIIMLWMDWRLALMALSVLPLLAIAVMRFRGPMKEAVRQQRRQEGALADIATDSLGAIRAVQGFGLEAEELDKFAGSNRKSERQGVLAAKLEARLKWATDIATAVVMALVVGYATVRIMTKQMSVGELVVFLTYLRAFSRPLRRISRTAERIARTTTAAERIVELLEITPEIRDSPNAIEAPALSGAVHFEGVSFTHHGGTQALHRVSLSIRAGERLGVVGPTGAGKSTLFSLVPRFIDPSEGRVLFDGHDARDLTIESLRRQVSFVFQEPNLFATSIAQNIAAGRPGASREDIVDAARRAGIDDVIAALPQGYDTVLGDRGGTLSGGQRQCVAIARAMLRDAPIVLLDEPTTGLDARSATQVVNAMRRLIEGRTVVMISHDLRRLRDTDRIVVLKEGHIVQEGTWQDLAATRGLFQDLENMDTGWQPT